ncbi:MAG TPA: hypothetical protein VM120_21120 [Bryobacteraceae bacterium]|nr:hypothetical protein [Bryobacteraceae bacterium]
MNEIVLQTRETVIELAPASSLELQFLGAAQLAVEVENDPGLSLEITPPRDFLLAIELAPEIVIEFFPERPTAPSVSAGTSWTSGVGAPAGGSNGDWYLNETDNHVWKRVAGVWVEKAQWVPIF